MVGTRKVIVYGKRERNWKMANIFSCRLHDLFGARAGLEMKGTGEMGLAHAN